MRTDRFQPQRPVRDPAWTALLRNLPVAVVLSVLGAVFGWGVRYATVTSISENTVERVSRLEALVDKRLAEIAARQDQTDRDRESRTVISNKLVSDLGDALRGQIDAVNRKLDQRSEARGAQVSEIKQDLSNLTLRVCVLSGNKVSQCK